MKAQVKATEQYFPVVLYCKKMVLSLESVDEMKNLSKCYHSKRLLGTVYYARL